MDVLRQRCTPEGFNNMANVRSPNYLQHLNILNNGSELGREIMIKETIQDNSLTTNSPGFKIDDEIALSPRTDLISTLDVILAPVDNNVI